MRETKVLRSALIVAVFLGALWDALGANDAAGSVEVVHAGAAGSGSADPHRVFGAVADNGHVRQRGPTATPGGPTATPTAAPIVPPTLTPTPIRPDRTPGVLVEPKANPNVRQPSGILVSPVGDVVEAKPEPAGPLTKIDAELVLVPEHLRPGKHTLTLEPSEVHTVQKGWAFGGDDCALSILAPLGEGLLVGWYQREGGFGGCGYARVAQTAVNFDFASLVPIPLTDIERAVLTHDETRVHWTDGSGTPRNVPGCVAAVGVPTVDWPGWNDQIPNTTHLDVTPGSAKEWDLTVPFEEQVIRAKPRLGFVLRGSLEQLEAEDDTSCLSAVSNIRLQVTYEIPPDGPPPSTPR